VNIFTKRALDTAAFEYQDAEGDIKAWINTVKGAQWANFVELRGDFPKADDVDGVVVFNIRHNRYRMLATVKYDRTVDGRHINGSVYIKKFLTHADYDRWCGMSRQQREKSLWPQR
jgi:mRNA interferase HigB